MPLERIPANGLPAYREESDWRQYLRFLPMWLQPGQAANLPEEEWWTWRGACIHVDRYQAETAPATVVLLHGAGGYGRLLLPFGQLLHAAGYEVLAPDLPGYGMSQGDKALVDYEAWVDLACELVAHLRAQSARPIVLAGFSVGGYLAYLAAAKSGAVDGIIATTLADPRLPQVQAQFARHPLLARFGLPMLPWFDAIAGGLRLPIRWFSNMKAIANDPRLCEVFLADRRGAGGLVPVHFMRSLFAARPAVEPEAFDVCPVLLAHPAQDAWTTVEASRLVFDRLRVHKELVMLENCGHFPIEEPGVSVLRDAAIGFVGRVVANASAPPGKALPA